VCVGPKPTSVKGCEYSWGMRNGKLTAIRPGDDKKKSGNVAWHACWETFNSNGGKGGRGEWGWDLGGGEVSD